MTEQEVLTVSREKVYNFSAGPSMMPESVLNKAGSEISDYMGSGMSVMEMSHRSSLFGEIFAETKRKLRDALNVPDSHEILFCRAAQRCNSRRYPSISWEAESARTTP